MDLGPALRAHRRTLLAVAGGVVLVGALVALTRGRLLALGNVRELAVEAAAVALVAVGMALVMAGAQVDLSVGAQLALATGVAVSLGTRGHLPFAAVAVAAVLVGAALGALNGALVALGRLPSLLVTLATMLLFRHGLRWWSKGADLVGAPAWAPAGGARGGAGGRSWLVVVAVAAGVLAALAWALRSRAGRRLFPRGPAPLDGDGWRHPNPRPAAAVMVAFIATGALTGAAAAVGLFRPMPRLSLEATGVGFELEVIGTVLLASVLGAPDRLSPAALVAAAVALAAVGTALAILGVLPGWERVLRGALIAGVALALAFARRRSRAAEAAGVAR